MTTVTRFSDTASQKVWDSIQAERRAHLELLRKAVQMIIDAQRDDYFCYSGMGEFLDDHDLARWDDASEELEVDPALPPELTDATLYSLGEAGQLSAAGLLELRGLQRDVLAKRLLGLAEAVTREVTSSDGDAQNVPIAELNSFRKLLGQPPAVLTYVFSTEIRIPVVRKVSVSDDTDMVIAGLEQELRGELEDTLTGPVAKALGEFSLDGGSELRYVAFELDEDS